MSHPFPPLAPPEPVKTDAKARALPRPALVLLQTVVIVTVGLILMLNV